MKNSAHGDSSTGSELKAVEEACREASRTVEPCVFCASAANPAFSAFWVPFGHKAAAKLGDF
jgi:hypothetical protein